MVVSSNVRGLCLYTLVVSLSNHEPDWQLVLRQAQDERSTHKVELMSLVAGPRRRGQVVHDVADLAHALDEIVFAQHLLRRMG